MKRLISFSVFCFAMAIAPFAHSQTSVVLPAGNDAIDFTTMEGNGGGESNAFGRFNNTVLTVYNASVVEAAGINVGDTLTGLSFRVDGGDVAPNFTVDSFHIELGRSLNSAGSLVENDFGANFDGGPNVVHTGSVDFAASDFEAVNPNNSTGPANAFGPEIEFENDFAYTGGDLLIRYYTSDPLALDGVLTTSRADSVTTTFETPTFSEPGVFTLFGEGQNANTRFTQGFGAAPAVAPVLQFSVTPAPVPEPSSAALLMGIGLIGAVRRRRKK